MALSITRKQWLLLFYILNIDDCHSFLMERLPVMIWEEPESDFNSSLIDDCHAHILMQSQYAS